MRIVLMLGLAVVALVGTAEADVRETLYERAFEASIEPWVVEDSFALAIAYEGWLDVDGCADAQFGFALVHVETQRVVGDGECNAYAGAGYGTATLWPAGEYRLAAAGGASFRDARLHLSGVPFDESSIEERRVTILELTARLDPTGVAAVVFDDRSTRGEHAIVEVECAGATGAWSLHPGDEYILYVPPVESLYAFPCDRGEAATEIGWIGGEHVPVATFVGEPGSSVTLRIRAWP